MVFGVGIDCVKIERIAKSVQKPRFLQRVYSDGERALFESRGEKHAAESAAANFAAKEAFFKATGGGLGSFALSDVAALRKPSGEPYFALTGSAAAYMEENRLRASLSMTHDSGLAIAFVVLEKIEKTDP